MDFDFQQIAEVAMQLFLLLLVPLASLAAKALVDWAKAQRSKLPLAQQELVNTAVAIAVFAAEQLFGAMKGEEKLQYCIDWVEAYLSKRGVSVDIDELVAAIEARVYEELNKWKDQEAARA